MVFVKLIRNTHGGLHYLKEICKYPSKAEKIRSNELAAIGGYGVNPYDPDVAFNQMLKVKRYFSKEEKNPIIHYMISYDGTVDDAATACRYTIQLARYFQDQYQVIWAVHHKPHGKSLYHAHLVINPVCFRNGRMYHSDMGELRHFCGFVANVTHCKVRLEIEGHTHGS